MGCLIAASMKAAQPQTGWKAALIDGIVPKL